ARLGLAVSAVSEGELAGALSAAGGGGVDLARELPVRAHLFALDGDEHVLLLGLPHISAGGWWVAPLLRGLGGCSGARERAQGREGGLAALPVQYADYTLWQREVLGEESEAGSAIARQLCYWRDRLSGLAEQIELPSDRPRPAAASYRGGSVALRLSGELHAG